jgi:hypothetical protein
VGDLLGQAIGQADVVGVHPGDQVGAGEGQRFVEGPDVAGVGPGDDFQAGISRGDAAEDRRGFVRRAVVDDDQFQLAQRLVQDAYDGGADKPLAVVDRQDDGDGRDGIDV